MSKMISGLTPKYADPRNPVVTIGINGTFLPNILVDLGATINAMTVDTMTLLQLNQVRPTPIVLEFANKSIVNPIGILEDVVITVASWEYPIDFIVISPKTTKTKAPNSLIPTLASYY